MTKEEIKILLDREKATTAPADDLRQSLNEVICKYDLEPAEVLHIMGRLAAGYINLVNKSMPDLRDKDLAEAEFLGTLTFYLSSLDAQDVRQEMEKEERRNVN